MPKKGDKDKPRGRMSSYAFFVQCCREEHKRKHPGENVVFDQFSKKCAEKWKEMVPKEKKRFEEMAEKDKIRYDKEMANYSPEDPKVQQRGKKRTKDPNAPKRALSAFFIFCQEERPKVREALPAGVSVGEIAKELGRRWEKTTDRTRYDALADKERKRYEKEMAAYRAGTSGAKAKASPAKKAKVVQQQQEDDDDDDDDDEEEEDEDDDDDE